MGSKELTPQVERISNPLDRSSSLETLSLAEQYLQLRQTVNNILNPYKAEIVVRLPNEGPYKVVHLGDTHYAHDQSDPTAIPEAVRETGVSGILVTQGNLIEGVSPKFISTNTIKVGFDLDKQERLVGAMLGELVKDGRVVPLSRNTCHEGWAVKNATHDPILGMVDPTTPVLFNGGQVVFRRGEETLARIELYHNFGSGDTKQSPEGGVRARYREAPVGDPNRPDEVVGAHMHQLTAGQDVIREPMTEKDITTSLGVVGTAKGTKDHPDEFLVGLGVPPRDQPGDAGRGFVTIIKDKPGARPAVYPVVGYERADRLFEAEQLWEDAQRTHTVEEIKAGIVERHAPPIKVFDATASQTRVKDSAVVSEGDAPVFKSLIYRIDSDLPIRVQFLGNLRVGSESFDRARVLEILKGIDNDEWAYWFATRRLLNQGTAEDPNRLHTLRNMAHVLGTAKTSLLGIMDTDELTRNSWSKKRKRDKEAGGGYAEPVLPGDYLYHYSEVKGTPLMSPETVVRLGLGDVPYSMYIRDKLSHLTSLINPFHGLTRVSQIWGIQADVLVGGNTEGIGWRTWMRPSGQLEVVVPGGFAEYTDKGVGNRIDYPEGGQGVVLFPKEKMLFSGATADDVRDMHEALWMWEGLRQEKTLDKTMRKLAKTKKAMRAAK